MALGGVENTAPLRRGIEGRSDMTFRDELLGKPSVTECWGCAVCGAPANNLHHVVFKGMGGTKREDEIPLVKLCGSGTTGCHGKVHQHLIHLHWDDARGGWVYYVSPRPINDFRCWQNWADRYEPLPGWVEQEGL